MADVVTTKCPACGCPDQRVSLNCGFCGAHVPVPADALNPDGTVRVEEVLGYRGWTVDFSLGRHRPRLASPTMSRAPVWEPGQWMIADCMSFGRMNHMTPADANYHGADHPDPDRWCPTNHAHGGHGCGFYAARDRAHLVGKLPQYTHYTPESPVVIGQVQMAGKIIFASNGFRAQRVRPRVIYVPHEAWELGRDLKAEYGPHDVKIEMSTTSIMPAKGAGAIKWCQKCGAKMTPRSLTCDFCSHTH